MMRRGWLKLSRTNRAAQGGGTLGTKFSAWRIVATAAGAPFSKRCRAFDTELRVVGIRLPTLGTWHARSGLLYS